MISIWVVGIGHTFGLKVIWRDGFGASEHLATVVAEGVDSGLDTEPS